MASTEPKNALVVFAREPRLGKVKTRLQKHLPAEDVLDLYKEMLSDTLRTAGKVDDAARLLYYTGSATLPFLRQYEGPFQLRQQRGEDLGARMLNAARWSHLRGYAKTVIIGTDCPTLAVRDIRKAFHRLDEFDCVVGPSRDGGYYLIGLKRPEKALFQGIVWGSDHVLVQTLNRARQAGMKTCLLEEKQDIDTWQDLREGARLSDRKRHASRPAGSLAFQEFYDIV